MVAATAEAVFFLLFLAAVQSYPVSVFLIIEKILDAETITVNVGVELLFIVYVLFFSFKLTNGNINRAIKIN